MVSMLIEGLVRVAAFAALLFLTKALAIRTRILQRRSRDTVSDGWLCIQGSPACLTVPPRETRS
jgi:hypothetical protein